MCKKLREINPWTPILFYSGGAYERDKQQAFAAGAQGYLVKPVDNDELIEEVSRIISAAKHTHGDNCVERGGLKGRIELPAEAQSYAVEVSFFAPRGGGPSELIISGNTGDNFEPWRRNFPFREFFARSGDAACPPVPKVS